MSLTQWHPIFCLSARNFVGPLERNGIIGIDLKFAGYVHHYKILTDNIICLIMKKQDGHHKHFFVGHEKCL